MKDEAGRHVDELMADEAGQFIRDSKGRPSGAIRAAKSHGDSRAIVVSGRSVPEGPDVECNYGCTGSGRIQMLRKRTGLPWF
jgi:hypothetical protein